MTPFQTLEFKSLAEPLVKRFKKDPEKLAMIFIEGDESEKEISVKRLHSGACSFAKTLKESGVKPGDIVIIALRHSLDLIYAFWGTQYLGAIPSIFIYKGPMTTTVSYIERLNDMVRHANPQLVVTLPELEPVLKENLSGLNCQLLSTEEVRSDKYAPESFSDFLYTSKEQIAYIQYTSGTTGMQKGVMLSHRAIMNFVQSAAKALQIGNNDVIINWLPLYHDFGLFAGLILPLFCEIPAVLLSPFLWLRRPKTFFGAIHNYQGTISFLPNSGHNHMVRSISDQDLDGMNLSSLRVLINGAEPILYRTQEMFLERFAPYGFKGSTLVSGYGMAENTLGVTFSVVNIRAPIDWIDLKKMQTSQTAVQVRPDNKGSTANVGSGIPMDGVEIKIVDEKGNRISDRHIGEIVIRSNFLFSGYHKRQDLTDKVLVDGWYYTGDMGYMAGGQLYISGRKKDLIIVGGGNIHPEDLEAIAGSISGIHPDSVVAFGILDENLGTEKIVIICGLNHLATETEKLEIERKLRYQVFQELEVTLGEVHLVKKSWIAKTHNGKIARTENREKYKKFILKGN